MKPGYTSTKTVCRFTVRNKLLNTLILSVCSIVLQAQTPQLVLPLGHSSLIHDIAITSDEQFVLTCSRDKTIKLWNVAERKEIRNFEQHQDAVYSLAMSANNKFFFSASADNTVLLWDIKNASVIKKFTHHRGAVTKVLLTPDNQHLITVSTDKTIQVVSLKSGEVVRNYECYDEVKAIRVLSNLSFAYVTETGKYIQKHIDDHNKDISGTLPGSVLAATFLNDEIYFQTVAMENYTFNVVSKQLSKPLNNAIRLASMFTANNQVFASSESGEFYQLTEQKPIRLIKHESIVTDMLGLKNGTLVYSVGTIVYTRIAQAKPTAWLKGNSFFFNEVCVNQASGSVAFAGRTNMLRTFNVFSNSQSSLRVGTGELLAVDMTLNAQQLFVGSQNNRLYKITNGKIDEIGQHQNYVTDLHVYKDTILVSASKDGTATVWNTKTNKKLVQLAGHKNAVTAACISDDGKFVITGSTDSTLRLWNLSTGKLIETFPAQRMNGPQRIRYDKGQFYSLGSHPSIVVVDPVKAVSQVIDLKYNIWDAYLADDKILSNAPNADILLWMKEDLSEQKRYVGHRRQANGFFTFYNFIVSSGFDQCIKFWQKDNSKEVVSIYLLDTANWVVLSPEGMFDASPGAMRQMYYVVGDEIVELNQLKGKYYEPHLLQKLLGISAEAIRSTEVLKEVKLYPKVKLQWQHPETQSGDLTVKLFNQGGGIGRAALYLNGKEYLSDIRPQHAGEQADSIECKFQTQQFPFLVAGNSNTIEVRAYNTDESVMSRGARIPLNSQATMRETRLPNLYVVSIGTSDYTGNGIDLKYAAKDATDIHNALKLSGNKLFGTTFTKSYLITTMSNSTIKPTKEAILQTLDSIRMVANPEDIFVLYLSGHGINIGGADGDFYYLTMAAESAQSESYADPELRKRVGISSAELTDKLKSIKALKQVLMIDACASGRVVDNLVTKRDISSSAIRALDRLRDRTGTHIITGCAADAVSYEASRYGQGLLTYSLLEGIKGASLRENEFVDILLLLNYARERVPIIASGIGGIQEPKVFSPYGAESFDIGQITKEEQAKIPLAAAKPLFVRSTFIDVDESEDQAGLSKIIDNELIESSASSARGLSLVFLDVKDFPEAYKLSGTYKKHGDKFVLNMRIKSPTVDKKSAILADSIEHLKQQILVEVEKLIE